MTQSLLSDDQAEGTGVAVLPGICCCCCPPRAAAGLRKVRYRPPSDSSPPSPPGPAPPPPPLPPPRLPRLLRRYARPSSPGQGGLNRNEAGPDRPGGGRAAMADDVRGAAGSTRPAAGGRAAAAAALGPASWRDPAPAWRPRCCRDWDWGWPVDRDGGRGVAPPLLAPRGGGRSAPSAAAAPPPPPLPSSEPTKPMLPRPWARPEDTPPHSGDGGPEPWANDCMTSAMRLGW